MPQTRVRAHTVHRNGKTYTVKAHKRRTKGAPESPLKLQPRRAWRNAKRAARHMRKRRRVRAALWGAAATSELLGFTVFKGVGTLFVGLGVAFAVLGYSMRGRT